jgi:hypothetical protein
MIMVTATGVFINAIVYPYKTSPMRKGNRRIAAALKGLDCRGSFCQIALTVMQPDLSLWGIYTMPLGLAICFGPVLLAWFKDEMDSRGKDKNNDKK